MKKSLMAVAVLAMSCMAAGCSGVRYVALQSVKLCMTVVHWLTAKADALTRKAREMLVTWRQPTPMLQAEAQYFRRQAERERPVVSPRWRMAPSV